MPYLNIFNNIFFGLTGINTLAAAVDAVTSVNPFADAKKVAMWSIQAELL